MGRVVENTLGDIVTCFDGGEHSLLKSTVMQLRSSTFSLPRGSLRRRACSDDSYASLYSSTRIMLHEIASIERPTSSSLPEFTTPR